MARVEAELSPVTNWVRIRHSQWGGAENCDVCTALKLVQRTALRWPGACRGQDPHVRPLAWMVDAQGGTSSGQAHSPGRTVAILEQGQGSGDLPRMHPVLTLNGITLASDLAPCLSVPSLETGVRGALLPRRNEDSMHISDGPRAGKPALPWPCNAADATRPRGAPSKGPCPGYGLPGWEIGAPSRTSDAARVRLLGKGRPGPDVLFSRTRCSSLATGHDPALPVA